MKNPPIWESATRPLFVRSVWLESGGGQRHRHFLLDEEPQRKYNDSNIKPKRDETIRRTQSYDYPDSEFIDDEDNNDLQLIGLQKEQFQMLHHTKFRPNSSARKITTTSNPRNSCWNVIRPRLDPCKEEPPSKRSSLQDINSTFSNLSNSDEKLAERVLNWLDLAGKTPLIRPESPRPETVQQKKVPILRGTTPTPKRNTIAIKPTQTIPRTTYSMSAKCHDSVKHITIIFNKEGIPVRYNRPARYTDLSRSGYTNNTRKNSYVPFAANIYNQISGDNIETAVSMTPPGGSTAVVEKTSIDLKRPRARISTVRKNYDSDLKPNSGVSRRILETSCNLREMKKQLHIFMPNLPKRSNLTVTDDMTSNLSGTNSDFKTKEDNL